MYGSYSYGQATYGGVAFVDAGLSASIVAPLVVSVVSERGTLSSVAVSFSPIVMIGADTIPRTSTIVVDSILTVRLTSDIPVYSVGLIAPVVSVTAFGSTTVSGVAAITPVVRVSVFGSQDFPVVANIVARTLVSITASVYPVVTATIAPRVYVSVTGLVVTHARSSIVIPCYVVASSVTGFVGAVSPTIRAVFSATATHVKSASADVIPAVLLSSTLNHGCLLNGAAVVPIYCSASARIYLDIQISAAIGIPIYPYIRCLFADDLSNADCAYVLTKQNSVAVLQ